MFKWLKESNRMKHLLYAIPIGFFLTILCVIGVASGLEYKDIRGNATEWVDFIRKSHTVRGSQIYSPNCEYSTMVSASASQAGDASSILVIRSKKKFY